MNAKSPHSLHQLSSLRIQHFFAVLPITFASFFIVGSYELVRSSANQLFQKYYGLQNLQIAMGVTPVALILILYGYNLLLSTVGPKKTLQFTTALSAFIIFFTNYGALHGYSWCLWPLFIIKEIYILLLYEQCWSLLNSSFKKEVAKRTHSFFTGISTSGAILGAILVARLSVSVGASQLPYLAALSLIPTFFLSHLAYKTLGSPNQPHTRSKQEALGLKTLKSYPILPLILGIVFATQIISAVLSVALQFHLGTTFANINDQTAYSGKIYAALNATSLVLQFFIAPVLLKYIHERWILLILPVINLIAVAHYSLSPNLTAISIAFYLFKSFDYSLFRIAKELFYIPLDFNSRYRAKEFIDVFGNRFSKGAAVFLLFAITAFGVKEIHSYIALSMTAIFLWIYFLSVIFKKHIYSA